MHEILLTLIALIYHECGHLLAASILSVPIRGVNICALGAVISFDFSRTGYIKEAIVHLSGPLFGIISGIFAYLAFGVGACYFVGISIVLGVVNLLPIAGFDGGGIARCVLSLFLLPDTVWRLCRVLSGVSILLLWTLILWIELRAGGNLSLMVFIIGILLGQMK